MTQILSNEHQHDRVSMVSKIYMHSCAVGESSLIIERLKRPNRPDRNDFIAQLNFLGQLKSAVPLTTFKVRQGEN